MHTASRNIQHINDGSLGSRLLVNITGKYPSILVFPRSRRSRYRSEELADCTCTGSSGGLGFSGNVPGSVKPKKLETERQLIPSKLPLSKYQLIYMY
jgi:hypothetical protein